MKKFMLFAITVYGRDEVLALITAASHHEAYEAYRAKNYGSAIPPELDVIGADYIVEF